MCATCMCNKLSVIRLSLAALMVVSLAVGSACAGFVDGFDGSSLDPAWGQSFPQTSDGWYASTGQSTGVTYTVSGSQLNVTAITGVTTEGWNNVWALSRSVSDNGNDFTATLDFSTAGPYSSGSYQSIHLKAVDSNGWLIAGGAMFRGNVLGTEGFHEIYGFDYSSPSNAAPCDINNASQVKYPSIWTSVIPAATVSRFVISRASDVYTLDLLQGPDYANLTSTNLVTLGTSARAVASIQLAFEINNSTDPGSGAFVVDQASFAVVPEPSSLVLVLVAGLGLLAYAWRKRK